MIDRVFQSFDYDAAIMGLGGGDADPESGDECMDLQRHVALVAHGRNSARNRLGARTRPTDAATDGHARLCQAQAVLRSRAATDRRQPALYFPGNPEHSREREQRAWATSTPRCSTLIRCGMRTNSMCAVQQRRTRECDERNRNRRRKSEIHGGLIRRASIRAAPSIRREADRPLPARPSRGMVGLDR
jgi:hypothetical protein